VSRCLICLSFVRRVSPERSLYGLISYGATSNFATGPATGARDLISRVTTVRRTCPDTKFVFVGYSQGAMVVVTAENDGGLPQDSVAAAILYGR
jgi:hypothetical protein